MAQGLVNRMMLAIRAGLQFGGKRKLYEVFGYPAHLSTSHLLSKYQRQDITSRIVDMPPEEMWAIPPEMKPLRATTDKWTAFTKHVGYWEKVIQADKLLSFGPFSVMWVGLRGAQGQPAPRTVDVDDILYLQSYGGENVRVKTFEDNVRNPRFGQPLLYEISVGPQDQPRKIEVHYSRIIHVVDRPLQGSIFGEPRLAQVYNILDDILKMGGGSAETFWLTANRGMQVDIDKDMDLQPADAEALEEELDEFQHQLRRYVRTRGVKINSLGSDVADPRGVFEVLISILAGTTSIPQRILMGSEAGQLASEQDRANWAEYLERRRRVFGEPYVLRPTIRTLSNIGYLPEKAAEDAEFEWPEAFHMSPLEKANALSAKARATVNLSRRAQFGDPIISDEEARRMLGFSEKPKSGDTFPEPPPKAPAGDPAEPKSGPGKQGGISQTEAPAAISDNSATLAALAQVGGKVDDLLNREPPMVNVQPAAPNVVVNLTMPSKEHQIEYNDRGDIVRVIEKPIPAPNTQEQL